MPARPWIDDFTAGYMQRVMHKFRAKATASPGSARRATRDKKMFGTGQLEDGVMQFTSAPVAARPDSSPLASAQLRTMLMSTTNRTPVFAGCQRNAASARQS